MLIEKASALTNTGFGLSTHEDVGYGRASVLPQEEDSETGAMPRRRLSKWVIAAVAATLAVGVAFAVRARVGNRAAGKPASGSIDWRLSLFSGNKIEFRPSLSLWPPERGKLGSSPKNQ
ncbi:MAG TPA: hypothetical protein VFR33_14900 [Candidatus Dormibacteraeota bacterium]|nr:hypothetical protein [Candidatus Dormibacteraeota bacterium]